MIKFGILTAIMKNACSIYFFLFLFIQACGHNSDAPKTVTKPTVLPETISKPVELKQELPEEEQPLEEEKPQEILLSKYFTDDVTENTPHFEINEPAVIAIGITDQQLDKVEKELGEDYFTVVDDRSYYTYVFEEHLDSLEIPIVRPDNNTRYLKLTGLRKDYWIDLEKEETSGLYWSYILFNTFDEPKIFDDIVSDNPLGLKEYLAFDAPLIFEDSVALWEFAHQRSKVIVDSLAASRKKAMPDKVFVKFLNEYVQAINQLNHLLYQHQESEIYNTIIWVEDSLRHPKSLVFHQRVNELGYRLIATEGSILIERNSQFLDSVFLDLMTSEMSGFFKAYSQEIDEPFAIDGGIAISIMDLGKRAVFWENFINENPDFILKDHATKAYDQYQYYYLAGMDNTPAFAYENEKFLYDEFKETYKRIVEQYPKSELAKTTTQYMELLEANDYRLTDSVRGYLTKHEFWN